MWPKAVVRQFPLIIETAAYLLVTVIGLKPLADWGFNLAQHPHVVDFHRISRPEFWIFWIAMLVCLASGFLPKDKRRSAQQ